MAFLAVCSGPGGSNGIPGSLIGLPPWLSQLLIWPLGTTMGCQAPLFVPPLDSNYQSLCPGDKVLSPLPIFWGWGCGIFSLVRLWNPLKSAVREELQGMQEHLSHPTPTIQVFLLTVPRSFRQREGHTSCYWDPCFQWLTKAPHKAYSFTATLSRIQGSPSGMDSPSLQSERKKRGGGVFLKRQHP